MIHTTDDIKARLGLLARADAGELAARLAALGGLTDAHDVRAPEIGAAMAARAEVRAANAAATKVEVFIMVRREDQ